MTVQAKPSWRNRIVRSADAAPGDLVPNERNWRRHPKRQLEALDGALDEVGWVQQVIVNERTGRLVDGHARVARALARGEASVPVLYVDLSDAEEALVLASLDPLGAMAERDGAKLDELLALINVDDAGLTALLHELSPRRARSVDPDEMPELVSDPGVVRGEVYALGQHRLMCGDSTNAEDVARLLDGAAPSVLVTDPPYGVQLDPTWRDGVYNALGPAEKPYMRRRDGHRNTTLSGDTRVDWSEAFALVPSLTVGYVWHAGAHAHTVAEGLLRIGFEIVSQVIWDKGLFAMGRSWYHWEHEPCWVVRKPGVPNLYVGPRDQSTVWRVPSPKMIMSGSQEAKHDHPAQKPVALAEIPILSHAGDVYDAFLGSGTTLIAAERLNRRCLGMEIEPRYARLIIDRWQAFTRQEARRVG